MSTENQANNENPYERVLNLLDSINTCHYTTLGLRALLIEEINKMKNETE